MKKNYCFVLIAAIAMFITGNAFAQSTIGLGPAATAMPDYNGEFTIASESFGATYTIDLSVDDTPNYNIVIEPAADVATAEQRYIKLVADWGVNAGDRITFTFTNAKYFGTDFFLYAEESEQPNADVPMATDIDADGDALDVVQVATNISAMDATNGVSAVTVRVNQNLTLFRGIVLLLCKDDSIAETDDDGRVSADTASIALTLNQGLVDGDTVDVSVSAEDQIDVIGNAACTNTIYDVMDQYDANVSRAATSVIDVNATAGSRQSFVDEDDNDNLLTDLDEDTTLQVSSADMTWTDAGDNDPLAGDADDDGAIEDAIDIECNDGVCVTGNTLTVVLTPTTTGAFSTEDFTNNGVYVDFLDATDVGGAVAGYSTATAANADGADNKLFTDNGTSASAVIYGTEIGNSTETFTDDVVITLPSDEIVVKNIFTLTFELEWDQSTHKAGTEPITGATSVVYIDKTYGPETSHTWTINGAVRKLLTIPSEDHTRYNGFVRIRNTTEMTGDVYGTLWAQDGTILANNVKIITAMDPRSTKAYTSASLRTALIAAGAPSFDAWVGRALFEVTANMVNIEVVGVITDNDTGLQVNMSPVTTVQY